MAIKDLKMSSKPLMASTDVYLKMKHPILFLCVLFYANFVIKKTGLH